MKKIKISKGLSARLTGSLIGGAGNALYEKYIADMLPSSLAKYDKYVKAAIGVGVPMLLKNNSLVASVGDGLVTCAANDIVGELLAGSASGVNAVLPQASRHMVGRAGRPVFPRFARRIGTTEGAMAARHMVNGTSSSPVC